MILFNPNKFSLYAPLNDRMPIKKKIPDRSVEMSYFSAEKWNIVSSSYSYF